MAGCGDCGPGRTCPDTMRYSKSSIAMAIFIAAGCVPLGFEARWLMNRPSTPVPQSADAGGGNEGKPQRAESAFGQNSPLMAEWRRLHESHGTGPEAMPELFRAIWEMGDGESFQRQALLAVVVSEWAELDPAGGLTFFMSGEGASLSGGTLRAAAIFRQWLAKEPSAAMAKLTATGKAKDLLKADPSLLTAVARQAPALVPGLAAEMEGDDRVWSGGAWVQPVADAFARMAGEDLESARKAAESVSGPRRGAALEGIAKVWGAKDFAAAQAWVKTLPEGPDRDAVLGSALRGLASGDPKAALEKVNLVPPGGVQEGSSMTTAARLLEESGRKDFDGTMEWLRDHPGKLGSNDLSGLGEAISQRLNADPAAFLNAELQRGTLELSLSSISSAIMEAASLRVPEIWAWLRDKPDSADLGKLQAMVLGTATYQNPDLAMAMARDLPGMPGGEKALDQIVQGLLSDQRLGTSQLERYLTEAPPELKVRLNERAFEGLTPSTFGDPGRWLERLDTIPSGARQQAIERLASVWAGSDPKQAAEWIGRVTVEEERKDGVSAVARQWLVQDSIAASQWVAALPPGAGRDAGALAVADAMADKAPEEAWEWAVSIVDAPKRNRAVGRTLGGMMERDPQKVLNWIERSDLPEVTRQQFRDQISAQAARAAAGQAGGGN